MQSLPDKLYFKIGEVATLLELKPHVLRYWETEFPSLKPVKSSTNQRLYRRQDVETALLIKDLLYRQGFTIAGARQRLHTETQAQLPFPETSTKPSSLVLQLEQLKQDLRRLHRQLTHSDN